MVWCIPKITYHLRATQAEGDLSFRWQQDFRFRKQKRVQGPLRVAVGPPGLPGLPASRAPSPWCARCPGRGEPLRAPRLPSGLNPHGEKGEADGDSAGAPAAWSLKCRPQGKVVASIPPSGQTQQHPAFPPPRPGTLAEAQCTWGFSLKGFCLWNHKGQVITALWGEKSFPKNRRV